LQSALAGCRIIVSKAEQATPLYSEAYRDAMRQLMARGYSVGLTANTLGGETWVTDQQAFPPGDVLFAGAIRPPSASDASTSIDDLRLITKLRDINALNLNQFPSGGQRELAPLQNLLHLGVEKALSDEVAASLASFPKLNWLTVTISSDASLQSIARLPHLNRLGLRFAAKDQVKSLKPLDAVAPLGELNLVDGGGKLLTEADAQAIANARPDVIVTWKNKRLEAPAPARGSAKRTFANDEWIDVLPLIDPALDKTAMGSFSGKNEWRVEAS